MARKGINAFANLQSVLKLGWRRSAFFVMVGLTASLTVLLGLVQATGHATIAPVHLAQTVSNESTQQALQQGRTLFQAGRWADAIAQWQQAVQVASRQGDRLTQAIALSNMALAYQQMGEWTNANTAIAASLQILAPGADSTTSTVAIAQVRGQVLNTQGKLHFAAGQFDQALEVWQQATNAYTTAQDGAGATLSLLNQTQALKAMGLHKRANTILESLYQVRKQQTLPLQLAILLNYGDNLRLIGRVIDPQSATQSATQPKTQLNAQIILQQGLELAKQLQSPTDTVSALISLGNTARAQQQLQATRYADRPNQLRSIYQEELRYYQQIAVPAEPTMQKVQTWLQAQHVLVRLPQRSPEQQAQVQSLTAQIQRQLNLLPVSRPVVYARLQLAENLITLHGTAGDVTPILAMAATQAESLGDFQIQSYALWRQFYCQALQYYQQAVAIADANSISSLNALLNEQSLILDGNEDTLDSLQRSHAEALSPLIQTQLEQLPLSHQALYRRIHFAQNLIQLGSEAHRTTAIQLLESVVDQADTLNDLQAKSYGLGDLGHIYEQRQQWQKAQTLTQQALSLAKAMQAANLSQQAANLSYRWQWQLGRLLKAQGDIQGAIATYTQAVESLNLIRQDLATINTDNADVQFSFRLNAEPVYLELVELLLQPGPAATENQRLSQARSVIESLQVAELENFFQEACAPVSVKIEGVDPTAAIVYPIVLADRLDIILSLYDATAPQRVRLRHYSFPVAAQDVEQATNQFRQSLIPSAPTRDRFTFGQKLYDWLIRPAEADLAQAGVKTLVFIMNGNLRNIPMAALYDGQQFLIQKYRVALTPGLQLIDPQPLQRQKLNALIAGLTEARQGFPALPSVETEVKEIQSLIPSKVILNEKLTDKNLESALTNAPFNAIHLATHGQFSSNADQTFILTWDQKLNVKQFDALLRTVDKTDPTPVELLVLSACQTAAGDKRASLGLAGIAVRSGARSTIASLWPVNDEATAVFMTSFYQALKPGVSKAEALSVAQRDLLEKYPSPYYWAPFVLVGNWL